MVTAIVELNEIDDVAVRHPIIQIAQRPAQDKAERHLKQAVTNWTPNAVNHHNDGSNSREKGQQQGFSRRTHGRKDPKGYTCISYIRNVKKAVYYRYCVVQLETGLNQGLGPTVQEKRGNYEKNIWKPRFEF